MSRLEEVEADKWAVDRGDLAIGRFRLQCTSPNDIAKWHNDKARTLAAEVDELRGKLDDVRMGIGCARGQRTTQYCADAAQRDAVITKLLAMLKPGEEPVPPADPSTLADWNLWSAHHSPWLTKANCYRFACEIAGRTE